MERQTVIAAYNATDEAADGLALARLLADLTGTELVIARVLREMIETPARATEGHAVRDGVMATRRSVLAALPDEVDTPILPLLDARLARALHAAARARDAEYLVLGSSHHHGLGRMLLGSSAATVIDGSPCPVAIAPPGFRERAIIVPEVVGAAYDGSPSAAAALGHAIALCRRLDAPLRIITVDPPHIGGAADANTIAADGRALAHELNGGIPLDSAVRAGDPAHVLIDETDGNVGVLVIGSRGRGALARAVLGSVSTSVLHEARRPLIVVPRSH